MGCGKVETGLNSRNGASEDSREPRWSREPCGCVKSVAPPQRGTSASAHVFRRGREQLLAQPFVEIGLTIANGAARQAHEHGAVAR